MSDIHVFCYTLFNKQLYAPQKVGVGGYDYGLEGEGGVDYQSFIPIISLDDSKSQNTISVHNMAEGLKWKWIKLVVWSIWIVIVVLDVFCNQDFIFISKSCLVLGPALEMIKFDLVYFVVWLLWLCLSDHLIKCI